jgi:hypothetical protein
MDVDCTTRYELELEMIERRPALSDRQAMELLRREFALALNAGNFSMLAEGDVAVDIVSRSVPQEGVGRFGVVMELCERGNGLSNEVAVDVLQREFRRALNAAHFWRVSVEDIGVTVLYRRHVSPRLDLRAAV